MKLATTFAGFELPHPIMNAAGTCKTFEQFLELSKSAVSAIMVGSITKEPRNINPGNVWEVNSGWSMNSLGLPNPGLKYYVDRLPEMRDLVDAADKLLIASVAGFNPEENAGLAKKAIAGGAHLVEVNLGCPNIFDGGVQKGISSFDLQLIHQNIQQVHGAVGNAYGLKLSPYSNPEELRRVADLIQNMGPLGPGFITICNTFPNAFARAKATGKQLIATSAGFAGYAGPSYKPIAMGQVLQFRSFLPQEIQIIGVGGVATGQDVWDYRETGASMVQVATEYLRLHNARCFSDMLTELVGLCDEK